MSPCLGTVICGGIVLCVVSTAVVLGQPNTDSTQTVRTRAVKLFIDCQQCDLEYVRNELTFVNHVRDRNEAQVDVLITTQRAGNGGTEYTLTFLGQQEFVGIDDTLLFNTNQSDTQEMSRNRLVKSLKLGLIRYVAKSPLAEHLSISYASPSQQTEVVDKWDYWVFSINTHTFLNGEQTSTSRSLFGSLSANRITKDLKVNFSLGKNYSKNTYDYEDFSYESVSEGNNFNSLIVASIDDHWSAGGSLSGFSSTFSNAKFSFNGAPAIEYDLFPYSESTRRQLRFLYRAQFTSVHYIDTTIYDKVSEFLWSENLSIALDLKEPWGSAGLTLTGSHYFHDLTKYSIELFGNLSLRLVEGFSLNLFGDWSRIHDQLSLARQGATQEDVLLQRKALETQYRYFVSIGVSYTFGSIFNNIVNPRFGSGSGGFSFSFSN